MELFDHTFWILEFFAVKAPGAVALLPIVIDHEDANREAFADNILRVFENIIFILVVLQFNPGIVLRGGEKQGIGNFARRRKKLPAGMEKRFFQGSAAAAGQNRTPGGVQDDLFPGNFYPERFFTPDIPAFAGEKKRRRLIGLAVRELIVAERCIIQRRITAVQYSPSPPFFPRQQLDLFARTLPPLLTAGGEKQRAKKSDGQSAGAGDFVHTGFLDVM